jgi:hypothetical protein
MSRRRKRERKILRIPENFIKERFDFETIKRLAYENGLEVYLKGNNKVLEIRSRLNVWISPIDKEGSIRLYHVVVNSKPHYQRSFLDYEFMFRSISTHDEFKLQKKGVNIVDEVMSRYKNNQIPKFKMN